MPEIDDDEMLLDSLDCEHSSQESCALATDHLWSHSSLDPSQHASSVETMAQPESNDSRLFIAGYDIVNVDQESSWMETRRSSVANTLHEDTTDLLPEAPSRPPEECQPSRDHALQRIESIFEEIADSLLSERREVTISFPLHRKARDGLDGPGSSSTEEPTQSRFISFPGKTAEEAWRFSVLVRILELMHESLLAQVTITKRDLYYRDPALFGTQAVVDRYVDFLSSSLQLPRSNLCVVAAAKGLMAGNVTLCKKDGSRLFLGKTRDTCLIPQQQELLSVNTKHVKLVLVVEKEATFQSVISSADWQTLCARSVLITGKGYPDIATRAMVRLLSCPSPRNGFCSPPVYGLVDFDPDGLAILSVYKYGSLALVTENATLVTPNMMHIGLSLEHVLGSSVTDDSQGLLSLTSRDRKKAQSLLGQHALGESGIELQWRAELQMMLMLNVKAELQILDSESDGLERLIQREIAECR